MNQETTTEDKPRRGRPPKEVVQETTKQDSFEGLKALGIPLQWVVFQNAVRSWNDTPQFQLFDANPSEGAKKEKQAKLWATPHFLVWEAQGKRDMIPMSNVRDMRVL